MGIHCRTIALAFVVVTSVWSLTFVIAVEEPSCPASLTGESSSSSSSSSTCSSTCSLYLAPSSIPGAGLGVYTAVDVAEGWTIGEPDDLMISIADDFKTLPYRGQQQFLSWLGYVWPNAPDQFYHAARHSFPSIPASLYRVEEGLNAADGLSFLDNVVDDDFVGVFAPGLASQVNSHPLLVNIEKDDDAERQDMARVGHGEPGDGSFSPHLGVSFLATEDIPAGSELFLDYGDQWHEDFEDKSRTLQAFETIEDWAGRVEGRNLPTEQDKRSKLENPDFGSHGDQFNALPKKTVSDEAEVDPVKDVEWLKREGVCIDSLYVGRSTKPQAGRGAFARHRISQGSIVSPSPLLALKRDDLVIYEANGDQSTSRDVLNFDQVEGQELLLNYCYGDPDSPMLLVPIAPIVNFVNHDGSAPNAEIRWPDEHSSILGDPSDWLDLHPLDVLEMSGKLMMDIVALRDIEPGEEIFIDYGSDWEDAWGKHVQARRTETEDSDSDYSIFRHEINVPKGFFPDVWKQEAIYEIAPRDVPLKAGELEQLKWAHNGNPVAKSAFRVGLPTGFSQHIRKFSEDRGITAVYKKLFDENILQSDEWRIFNDTQGEQWFAHRYMSDAWKFNMHYIAAWDESARVSFLRAMGSGGFDVVLDSIGNGFGLDNMTCFHSSFMGVTECDNSLTHADVYASGEKGFNIIFPLLVVEGSKPELDIISDDANIVVSVNYEYDLAFVLSDWGYHKTSPNIYEDEAEMRIVAGAYCAQIDETNAKLLAHIYDGEDPAPFSDQFDLPIKEIHWGNGQSLPK